MDISVLNAANQLRAAHENKTPCSPVRKLIGDHDLEKAYAVQNNNHQHLLANGFKVIGKKIGLTSKAVQSQLGVDQPDFGLLFDFMQVDNSAEIAFSDLMQPKAEAEIAFVLKENLGGENTVDDIINAIDYAVLAIEIVGSRVENWDIRITDTIADNAAASHFVLGSQRVSADADFLENCQMHLSKNGIMSSEGSGKACLGNPLNAVVWLANTMSRLGQPLLKGEIILSGALGPMVPFEKGDVIEASIDGMGEVDFRCG